LPASSFISHAGLRIFREALNHLPIEDLPKCGSQMEAADYLSGYGAVHLVKFGDVHGDKVIPFYCKNCG
jgi:predicted nucleic-acid-binding Zn-ribbon protein